MSAFLQNWPVQVCLVAGVYLSEAPDLPPPPPPPCSTLYENMYPFTYSHREGGRGGDEPVKMLEERKFTRGVENTNMTDCTSSP